MNPIFTKKIVPISLAIGLAFLLILGCWIFGYPYPYYAKNYNLYRFGQQLSNLQMPAGTQKVGRLYSEFGNLFGNSNKGDYVVAQLITSDMSQDELAAFFGKVPVKDAERSSDWWNNSKKLIKPEPLSVFVMPVSKIDETLAKQSVHDFFVASGSISISSSIFETKAKDLTGMGQQRNGIYLLMIADTQYVPDEFRCW
jgi:hypothetical protein